MSEPTGGSAILKPGPAPIIRLPTQKAEVEKQYSLDDIDPVGRMEAVLYGEPGTGKTVMWSTFPPPFRVIDADRGLKSLKWAFKGGKTALHCTGPHCLKAYRPVEEGTYPINPQAMDKMADMIEYWFTKDTDEWNTLIIDSATEVNLWAIYKGLHLNGELPSKEKALSKSDSVNERAKALLLTGEQDYKSAQGLFMGAIMDIRVDCARYNKNLVLVCHQWTDTQGEGDNVRVVGYKPWLIGQLRTRIAKEFDDVWHLEMFNGKEVKVQMHSSPLVVAKTRWGSITDIDKDADYRKMIERVRQYHGIKQPTEKGK